MQVVFKFTVANQPIVGFAKISVGERQMHLWKSVFNMIWLDIAQIQVMFKFWVANQPIVGRPRCESRLQDGRVIYRRKSGGALCVLRRVGSSVIIAFHRFIMKRSYSSKQGKGLIPFACFRIT